MVVGILLGTGLGLAGGIVAGGYAFSNMKPKNYMQYDKKFDEEVNEDDISEDIPSDADKVYPYLPLWCKFPDYEKTEWINGIIAQLWPYLDLAITEMVLEQAKAQLQGIVDKTPILDAVEIEHFELGDSPIKLGGIKSYESSDYECIFETMLMWGSATKFNVGVRLALGPLGIYLPVELNEIQLIARARITIRPLVEVLPCLGAVSVQLLEQPHYDFGINLINKLDILALPGIDLLLNYIVGGVIKSIALYPKSYSVPLMPNSGYPVPPIGMISISVEDIEGIKGSCTVFLEAKEGRPQKTDYGVSDSFNTKENNLVVDDQNQNIKITVKDFGVFKTKVVAEGLLDLMNDDGSDPDFIENYGVAKEVIVDLLEPGTLNLLKGIGNMAKGVGQIGAGVGHGIGKVASAPVNVFKDKKKKEGAVNKETTKLAKKAKESGRSKGSIKLRVIWKPFQQPSEEDEADDPKKQKESKEVQKLFNRKNSSQKVDKDNKGILTVTLRRAKNLLNDHGSCDPYVNMELVDESRPIGGNRERQQSTLVVNDPDARWGEKFEFVGISATSVLNFTVYDKLGLQEALAQGHFSGLIPGKKQTDPIIGRLRIPVGDVVKNGRIRDSFPLQEVEQGELDLLFEWMKVYEKN